MERDTKRIQVEMGMCTVNDEIVDGTVRIKVIRQVFIAYFIAVRPVKKRG